MPNEETRHGAAAQPQTDAVSTTDGDPRVTVYRVVDPTELAYLQATGNYGSNPHLSGKYFALTLEGALGFAGASVDEAVEQLYLGDDRFYRIIDIALKELLPRTAVIFVRVSGHSPVEFGNTWDPSSFGPFKHVIAEKIEISAFVLADPDTRVWRR